MSFFKLYIYRLLVITLRRKGMNMCSRLDVYFTNRLHFRNLTMLLTTRGKRGGGLLIGMTLYIKFLILRSLLKRLNILSISLKALNMSSWAFFYVLTFTVTFIICSKGRKKKERLQELKFLSHYNMILIQIGNDK